MRVFKGLSEAEQQELLTAVLNNSYHGILVLDAVRDKRGTITDFRYSFCNQKGEEGLGHSVSEVVGNTLLTLFPGVAEEGIFDRYVAVAETGQPYSFDQAYHRDGLAGYFHSSASKFKDGLLISFLETAKLVSESVNWKRLTKRYELATMSAGVGVWELDLQTNRLFWDSSMFDIYGTRPEEFRGVLEDWSEKVHPDDLEPAKAAMYESVSANKDVLLKFRIIPSEGVVRWIDARAKVEKDEHHNPMRIIGTNWDITKLQNTYDNLAEAKIKAEEANAAKAEFLAVMSHELRTPLNPVIGAAELLIETTSNEQDLALLDMIQNCGKSLLNLISDILDFCMIDAGRLSLEPAPTKLNEVTAEVISEFQIATEKKAVNLNFVCGKCVPAVCMVDPRRYRQIIRNLISNAVKFTKEGAINVEVSSKKADRSNIHIIVKVSDSGEGIPDNKQEFVFEHFTQLDSSSTRREGGTGLGLAICRKLCELMGGEISLESNLGAGSTFTASLPSVVCDLSEVEEPTRKEEPLVDSEEQSTRALLIDDDAQNLSYLRTVLQKEGIHVRAEQDPRKGQELINSGNYDIAFLDIHMPGITGLDIVRKFREGTGDEHIRPVVAITADLRDENLVSCQESGFDRVLHKPVKPVEIRQALKDLLL